MNIAIFIEAYIPYTNGVITHVSMLRDSFISMGHKVLIVTADPNYRRHCLRGGILYCPAAEIKKLYGYGAALPNSRTRERILREFAPDVIHIHQEFGISLFGMRYAKKHGIPTVYTLHTMYDDYFNYITKMRLAETIVKDVFCTYMRYFVAHADAVMSPSAKAVSFLHDNHICDKDITIVPNAIDTVKFDPSRFSAAEVAEKKKELGINPDDFTGIFVGRLGYEKSVDYLINFWDIRLKGRNNCRLIIVGDGPERENLTAMVRERGLEDVIRIVGRVEHEDIPLYLAAADYYISASLTEMMSISMLEAMASGLYAVLRFDKTNSCQITEGINGFFFHDEDELYKLLSELSSSDSSERRSKLKETTRDTMLRRNSDSAASEIIEIYRKCIDMHSETKDNSGKKKSSDNRNRKTDI